SSALSVRDRDESSPCMERGDEPQDPDMYCFRVELQAKVHREELEFQDRQSARDYEIHKAELAIKKAKMDLELANTNAKAVHKLMPTLAPATIATLLPSKVKGLQSLLSSMGKLTSHSSYSAWSWKLYQFVSSYDLQGYLEGTELPPDPADVAAAEQYWRESNILSAAISGLLDDTLYPLISHLGRLPSPKDLWDKLECIFHSKDSNQASMLLSELHRSHLTDNESPDKWIARIWELYAVLKDTKMAQTEAAICQVIIEGLPLSYREVVLALQRESDDKWTIANFAMVIRQHWSFLECMDLCAGSNSNSVGAFPASLSGSGIRPPNVRFKANGQRDPDLATAYVNVCRQCLGKGHVFGSKECPWYPFRVAAGCKPRKRSDPKQVNAAEVTESTGSRTTTSASPVAQTPTVTPSRLAATSGTQAYPALVQDGGVEVYSDFTTSYPATIDCPKSVEAAIAGNADPDNFLLDTGAQ
ncbi:hypothetical protein FRC10_006657, partial [Ceratobasidium sp. 414]